MKSETVTYLSVGAVGVYGDRPLVRVLTKGYRVQTWVWPQLSPDRLADGMAEVGALAAHTHVVGHGVAGALALAVAQQVPVRSVAVLGLGADFGLDWRACVRRWLAIPCGRWVTLARMVRLFFGVEDWTPCRSLARLLAEDLAAEVPPFGQKQPWGVNVPLWVGGAADDPVVLPGDYRCWQLRPGDRQRVWPQGGHFWHYHHPIAVASELQKFWRETVPSVNFRELEHDTSDDRRLATVAGATEFGRSAFGTPGMPSPWENGTSTRGRALADRRGVVAGHHLG